MKGFSINPGLATAIQIVLTLANGVANGSLALTGILTPQQATMAVAVCQLLVAALSSLMSAYSSSQPGPLAPPDSKVVIDAIAVAALPSNASAADIAQTKAAATQSVAAHIP